MHIHCTMNQFIILPLPEFTNYVYSVNINLVIDFNMTFRNSSHLNHSPSPGYPGSHTVVYSSFMKQHVLMYHNVFLNIISYVLRCYHTKTFRLLISAGPGLFLSNRSSVFIAVSLAKGFGRSATLPK